MLSNADLRLRNVRLSINRYYADLIAQHGATPRGVDWSCAATQQLRFVQLLRICDFAAPFSLNDVGCGYGALLDYLAKRHGGASIDYLGFDLSPAMIRHAKRLWRSSENARFVVANASPRIADYSVASGIFNVKLDQPTDLWEHFIVSTIDDMHATSRRGFAFNLIAGPLGRDDEPELYCIAPARWVGYCEQKLHCSVEIIADYGMREFTVLVRLARSAHRHRSPQPQHRFVDPRA
jgi:SAM-dependent methyltransferase